ncbi:MAG TPA: hypothetical protein VLU06_02595 [Thermoanaerobaculia bacterium]|nr:hypothetical protein [Thermoanaerobaculia bacterium]
MRSRRDAPQLLLFLGGAATLTAFAITRLPPLTDLVHAPATPFDHSAPPAAVAQYRLFVEAAAVVPAGASVASLCAPRNPTCETVLHREAFALLPGRKVLAAAVWDTPTHSEDQADFLIIVGPKPATPPGSLVLETPAGSVWRRSGR